MAAQGVYNGLAEVGKLKATIGLVVAVCVALSCCASGGMALSDKHTAQVTATISNVNCASATTTCVAPANYSVSGNTYSIQTTWPTNKTPATVQVSYDPKNPADGIQGQTSSIVGIGMIVTGFLIVLCGYLIYRLTMAYKPLAAVEGVNAVASLI